MSGVRVLVGTRKGAFILSADGKRKDWTVSGPFFAGWEIYHMKGSPVDPERIYVVADERLVWADYAALDDGGKTWHQPGLKPGEPEGLRFPNKAPEQLRCMTPRTRRASR